MKTQETLDIEKALLEACFAENNKSLAKRYGCSEVTIGFARSSIGKGDEVVDFMGFEKDKQIFRCYEIKVSLSDLKSKCAKSFYGHYNYLVVPEWLYWDCGDISVYVPDYVGIITFRDDTLTSMKRAKKRELSAETVGILKDSLIRSMFYKYSKNR